MISNPQLQHTLLIYASFMAFYTFAVFCIPINRKNAPLFCESYRKHISAIIMTHAKFLLVLLGFMIFASFISPLLPNWMAGESIPNLLSKQGRSISIFAILCGLIFLSLLLVERFVMFLEYDANDSDSDNSPS
jgi:hypothetical protein